MLHNIKKRRWLFTIALALALSLCLGLGLAQADGDSDQVRVIVENTTYPVADGAPWDGTLVDKWVDIDQDSTMMSCVLAALGDYSQSGAETNYISEINGLSAGVSSWEAGWMGSLNDWMVNEGFGAFTVASGKLQADDVIRIMYTSSGFGADLGGSWENNDKTLKALSFDKGSLSPAFASATNTYTLTVPSGTSKLTVTPTAANKNFQVRIQVGDGAYLRPGARTVDVADGTVLTITCGYPSWPTMNDGSIDVPAVSYTVTVAVEAAANNAPTLAAGVNASGNTANATVGAPWTLDLTKIFTDADGDELTYAVKVGGADYVPAEASYSFTPAAAGATVLEFKANDGQADSSQTYSVAVTAAEAAFAIMEVDGDTTVPVPAGGYSYMIWDSPKQLVVVQTSGGEGTITYQWKKSTSATGSLSNISNQKKDNYTPDISNVGNTWYACQITFKPTGGSNKTITTDRVKVSVDVTQAYIDGKKPVFEQQPVGGTWEYGDTGDGVSDLGALLVAALDTADYTATDTKNLNVKWYVSTDDGANWAETSGYGKAPVQGSGVLPLYELPVGSYKFKCVATLAMKNLAGSTLSAATTSDEVSVTITPVSAWEGQGTESKPYLLKTAADLQTLSAKSASSSFSGIYFKFAADITLPADWTPVGTTSSRFAGNIDGDGHLLTVPAGEKTMLGCTQEASLKDLNIRGTQINGNGVVDVYTTGSSKTCITIENVTLKSGTQTLGSGFIGGYASGVHAVIIRDCTVEEGVIVGYDGSKNNVGSFGGDFNGTVENCVSHATVKGVDYVGGICGSKGQTMGDYKIINCTFDGTVTASGNFAGGISGGGYGGTQWGVSSAQNNPCAIIRNCLVTGSVSGADHVGGILGSETGVVQAWENGPGYIQDNLFAGTLTATAENASVGGVIGYFNGLDKFNYIENNYYLDSSAQRGVGAAQFVDTSHANPTAMSWTNVYNGDSKKPVYFDGVTYYNTENGKPANAPAGASKTKHNRTDDPLGADADKLAKAVTAAQLKDGSVTALLNSSDSSLGNWTQGAETPVHSGEVSTFSVSVAVYDYTAKDAGLTGASASGVVLAETSVTVGENATAGDAFVLAFNAANISYTVSDYGYFASINGLGTDSQYPQSGWMFSINDNFGNLGTKEQPVADGDRLEMHYSLIGYGTDVGSFFAPYRPTISSYTLAGVKKELTVVTTAYADWTTTFEDTVEFRVDGQPMAGSGTAQSPFVIPIELPADTDVSALKAAITTDLHPNYWSLVSGAGLADVTQTQDYRQPVSFAIQTRGGIAKTYYQVQVETPQNQPPALASGVNASGDTANATVGVPWVLDLSRIFTDADGDQLTYAVKVGDADYVAANASYSFTPEEAGATVLVFKANDGQADSTQTYSVTVTAVPAVTANVTLSMQKNNQFLLTPQTVAVSSGLAESYGYSDSVVGQVSALDALVRIHELRYEDGFTKATAGEYLVVNASGYVTKYNKENSTNIVFAVDGDYPNDLSSTYGLNGYAGYTVNQAPVADRGSVEFLVPQDTDMYADCYTWFQQGGQRISKLTVRAGQSFGLELQGYMYAFGGAFVGEDRVNNGGLGPMPEVQLATADPASGKLTGLEGKTTDDNGLVSLVFDEPGTYYLSASGEVSAYYGMFDTYVFSPWLEVTVLPSGGLDEVSADWKDFRNSDVNMAITDAPTPTSAETATLLWAKKLGSGWSESPSAQIIVDDSLIVMSGTKLYKLDLASGEVKAQATMVAAPSFGYTPPTYGGGMIFCPLGGGRVQAFNAKTLESLWVYTDSLGGQALSPITYSDGYIYTGFWNGEVADAAYVCLSVTDEDPAETDEAKEAAWRDVVKGGFYWAGSVVVGDNVIYGTDNGVSDSADGASAGAHLISRSKVSGALVSTLALTGDQRSSIAYANGRVYCTTKGGYLYSAALNTQTGALSDLKSNNFGAQSTSTPVVYKGRVYLGCGSGISATGSAGNLLVCDAETLDSLFAVGLQGYPQCSMLLSTAYESSEGYVYVYSTYNNNPGGVSLIKVKPDATTAEDAQLIEVFTPEAKNYCISSIICGKDGTLYYKNDSGNVFAVQDQFAITVEANDHGTVTVKDGDDEVTNAPAGTELAVNVTANAGWQLKELTLNGTKLSFSGDPEAGYTASFTMPAENATLAASYTQQQGEVEVVEAPADAALSNSVANSTALTAAQKADVLAAVQGATSSGLPTAADGLVRSLVSANPDREIKLVLYLAIEVTGVKFEGGAITELTLDITPRYALYLDGANEPAESGIVANSRITRSVTVSLPAPDGMTVNEHTRILHDGEYIKPAVSAGKMTFSVSSFSTFTVLADARIASVTFDPAGGKLSGGTEADYYPADDGKRLPTPTRDGYAFKGWYSRPNGAGSEYTRVSAELPDKLYAFWQKSADITVSFRLIGDWKHSDGVDGHDEYVTWIETTSYEMPAGSTVYDLFVKAISDAGLSQKGASNNYVSSIKAPAEFGGYWLSEFDNGRNSGWMYTVNGTHPDQGLRNWVLEDGDKVIWHYVDDYTQEAESKWSGGSSRYLNRWLEAEDISPARYIKKYGDTSLILRVGDGGTVSPGSGQLKDYLSKDVTFTITPDPGYQVKDVVVDGRSVGAVTSYTYKNLSKESRITVIFEPVGSNHVFPDVPSSHWAFDQINALAARGVVGGYPDGYFRPEAKITRAEFVVMLARLSGQSLPAYNGRFKDVTTDKYYAQAVSWAAAAGITLGDGKDNFLPDALISRQEMAAMLYRYASHLRISLPAGTAVSFTDSASIASYASTPVASMSRAGIISGYPDGSFKPAGNASRAEAAKMMYMLDALR